MLKRLGRIGRGVEEGGIFLQLADDDAAIAGRRSRDSRRDARRRPETQRPRLLADQSFGVALVDRIAGDADRHPARLDQLEQGRALLQLTGEEDDRVARRLQRQGIGDGRGTLVPTAIDDDQPGAAEHRERSRLIGQASRDPPSARRR